MSVLAGSLPCALCGNAAPAVVGRVLCGPCKDAIESAETATERHKRELAEQLGDDPVAASFKQAKELGAREEQKRRGRRWR